MDNPQERLEIVKYLQQKYYNKSMRKELKITKELTPKIEMCGIGACPAIFETNQNSYAIIGKKINAQKLGISKRVGKDEVLIEIPRNILDSKS